MVVYSHYITEHTWTQGTRLHMRMFGALSQDLQYDMCQVNGRKGIEEDRDLEE